MRKCGIIPWIIIHLFLFLQTNICYPLDTNLASTDKKTEQSDEIQYPNGTVVGKYSYKDNEGNPVNVQYYADKNSYGVELNSLKTYKVIESSTPKDALQLQLKPSKDDMNPMEPLLDLASEILNFKRNNIEKGESSVNQKSIKASHLVQTDKMEKFSNPDYETFYQNEVKAPKQCEKDKVRVYLVKEKRKARNALEDQSARYCDQL